MVAKKMCSRHRGQMVKHGKITAVKKGQHGTIEERFWNYVDRKNDDECWLWTGNKDKDGYGSLRTTTYQVRAHRVSYKIHYGEFQNDLVVRHRCNNPSCVNPAHLAIGTHQDNMDDKTAAGHNRANETHPNVKFSNETVRMIREATGLRKDIARKFGVSESQVGNIRSGAQRKL